MSTFVIVILVLMSSSLRHGLPPGHVDTQKPLKIHSFWSAVQLRAAVLLLPVLVEQLLKTLLRPGRGGPEILDLHFRLSSCEDPGSTRLGTLILMSYLRPWSQCTQRSSACVLISAAPTKIRALHRSIGRSEKSTQLQCSTNGINCADSKLFKKC
jgi:hypothetical protein